MKYSHKAAEEALSFYDLVMDAPGNRGGAGVLPESSPAVR